MHLGDPQGPWRRYPVTALAYARSWGMKRKRWKVIYFALAASIATHLLLGPLVHIKFVDAAPEEKPQRIIVSVVKPPTPAPTKPPAPVHPVHSKPVNHRPPSVHPIHPAQNDKNLREPADHPAVPDTGGQTGDTGPPSAGLETAGPTAEPAPTATPKPVCSSPYADAATIAKFTPETPQIALDQGLSGVAQVKVDLSADGRVLDASIFASTGSSILDHAAVDAAKRTTYAPKIVDCARVPGSYLFRVEFQNN